MADRRARTVTGVDDCLVIELADARERVLHRRGIRQRQIGTTDRAGEQEIAAEDCAAVTKHDVSRRVAGRMDHLKIERADREDLSIG